MALNDKPLAGAGVLLTRPAGQNTTLARRITSAGGCALAFPAIAIQKIEPSAETLARLQAISKYDLVVFISPNAVRFALPLLGREPRSAPRRAATGAGTARALAEAGLTPSYVPVQGSGGQALLSLPELQQVGGQAVLIVRGEGGREHLAEHLCARGARVDYAEVYRRTPPGDPEELEDWLLRDRIDSILVTSSAALSNLMAILSAHSRDRFLKTQTVVASRRMGGEILSLGASHPPIVAANAGDAALFAALANWWPQKKQADG